MGRWRSTVTANGRSPPHDLSSSCGSSGSRAKAPTPILCSVSSRRSVNSASRPSRCAHAGPSCSPSTMRTAGHDFSADRRRPGFPSQVGYRRIKYPGPDFGERCPIVRFQAINSESRQSASGPLFRRFRYSLGSGWFGAVCGTTASGKNAAKADLLGQFMMAPSLPRPRYACPTRRRTDAPNCPRGGSSASGPAAW